MCRPGSGSFVRHKKIDVGVTFLQAVKHRYGAEAGATTLGGVADDCNDAEEEMYVVGESNRITKVHMVGKDKITEKFRYTYVHTCTFVQIYAVNLEAVQNHITKQNPGVRYSSKSCTRF